MVEQFLHRRVEPVAFAQLNRQALLETARKNAGRIETLHPGDDRAEQFRRRAQLRAHEFEIGGQITRFVEHFD